MRSQPKGRGRKAKLGLLANSGELSTWIFGLPNSIDAITDDQGWTVIPYGLWPHTAGYQRFGMKQAEAIVDAFKSGWGRFKRAISGAPIYKGHPDNPQMANQYPDKTVYGVIADMEVRDDGLAIKQALMPAGQSLVANGLDRISPNWYVRDTGEKKNERPIYEPISIKSVGLVKKPNIPNLSLVNSKPEDSMKELLIKLLALSNEATDEQIVAAVAEFTKRPSAEELANAKNEAAVAGGKVAELTTKLESETKRANDGAVALANARKGEIDTLLANSIREGKIAAAEKDQWRTILEANLEAGRTCLANVKARVKTRSSVNGETLAALDRRARAEFANGDGGDSSENSDGEALDGMANRGAKIQKLVNEEMAQLKNAGCALTGNSLRNRAWANAKKHMPSLFTDGAHNEDDAHEAAADGSDDKPTKGKHGPQSVHPGKPQDKP